MKKQRKREVTPFSKILTALMDERNIGVREAARIAEVGASTVMSWRSGALPENYIAVKKLAEALGTTMSFLLTGEDETRAKNTVPAISEIFEDGGSLFDGYAKVTIQRLIPRNENKKK